MKPRLSLIINLAAIVASTPTSVLGKPHSSTPPVVHNHYVQAYSAYLNALKPKLMQNWKPPSGKNRVELTAIIAPDGGISQLGLHSNPTNKQAEDAAQNAFAGCEPLAALPVDSKDMKLIITLTSSVDPHGDSDSQVQLALQPIGQPSAKSTSGSNAHTKHGN